LSTRALAFGKRNELGKGLVTQNVRVENGQRVGGLRESIACFLETVIGVQIPGVVNVGEAGSQKGHREIYPGSEYTVGFIPKVKFEIVISDNRVQKAVTAIVEAARTGKIGDGKVFVFDIEECIRIRTKERGEAAI
jgi:nitrogen regulatory protein PII